MSRSPPAPHETLLRCERLAVGHRGRAILPPIDLELRAGELVAVVGRNGAGKSTWARTILGLVPPVDGRIERAPSLRTAYLPQVTALEPFLPLRAADVVAWGRLSRWRFVRPAPSREDREACERALAATGTADLAQRRFRELSDGQRQRVLLAKLFATEVDLAVLDEPTSAMDAGVERVAFEALARLARERRAAVVVVTHVLGAAAAHATRVLFFDREHATVRLGAAHEIFADADFERHFGKVGVPDVG